MKLEARLALVAAMKLTDLLILGTAIVIAAMVSFADDTALSFAEFLGMRVKLANFLVLMGFMLVWHWTHAAYRLYVPERILRAGTSEAQDAVKAALLGTAAIGLLSHWISVELMTPKALPALLGSALTMSVVLRYLVSEWLCRRPAEREQRHLLIVGTNARARSVARRIEATPELGYRLVGFVDDPWPGREGVTETGHPVVSDFAGFRAYLQEHVVDEVLVCTPVKSLYDRAAQILQQCEEQGVTASFLPDVFTPAQGRMRLARVEDHLLVSVETGGMRGYGVAVKRSIDVVVSALLLLAFSPLMALIALVIKVGSPGPVLFVQERVGLNKRRFRLYKFRTMVVDAERRQAELEAANEVSGPVFKITRDPRVTRVGHFLRKTSLDELPQLLNVLNGDMSLVGPRPLPVRDYRGFTEDWHRRRFSVRPGITCLWQVGGRSSIPFERWMEMDMEYIDHWSLLLDLKILLRTIPAVLRGSGAS